MENKFRVYNASGNYTIHQNEKTAWHDFEKKREEALKLARKNGDYTSYGRITLVSEKDAKNMGWK